MLQNYNFHITHDIERLIPYKRLVKCFAYYKRSRYFIVIINIYYSIFVFIPLLLKLEELHVRQQIKCSSNKRNINLLKNLLFVQPELMFVLSTLHWTSFIYVDKPKSSSKTSENGLSSEISVGSLLCNFHSSSEKSVS